MKTTTENLYALLDRLRHAKIHYRMGDRRDGAVSIDVAVPGERWEIDMLADGTVDIEVFKSDGTIHDEAKLAELFERFSDQGKRMRHWTYDGDRSNAMIVAMVLVILFVAILSYLLLQKIRRTVGPPPFVRYVVTATAPAQPTTMP